MESERFLVVGATGTVGAEVVRALVERGALVRVLVRRATTLPPGVEPMRGELGDRAALARALDGVNGAFFVTPHDSDEETLGLGFVEACEAAGVARIVFAGAMHPYSDARLWNAILVGLTGLVGPHYKAKLRVEARVRASTASPVVLMPSNFFQNDEPFAGAIASGVYPQPLGRRGVNRVDCRDIGDAAARALLDREAVPSGVWPLVGPAEYDGLETAALWSRALGRPVAYGGDAIAPWSERAAAFMPPAKRADFEKTYAVMQRYGARASNSWRARTTALLGRPARSYEAYVDERAAEWSTMAAA